MQQNPNKADGIERLLAPSGLDFEAILRAAPDLYLILSPELIILDASDAYLRATLITREIACGHHIFEIFPDPEPSATGVSNLRSSLERVLKNKVVDIMPIQKYDIKIQQDKDAPFEERYWSPINSPVIGEDGKVKYIIHRVQDVTRFMRLAEDNVGTVNQELISRNLQTALELYLREQELSAAHERLYESEERFSLIINSTKDYAIYMLDPEGFILTWNEGAQNIKDYKPEEIIGKHFSVLYPAEDRKAGLPARNLKIAKEAGRYEEEGWRIRKDGSRFWCRVIISPIYKQGGQFVGFGKITCDLTEKKKAEDELKAATERAQEASQAKSEFLSNISHELRTPLNGIIGIAQYIVSEGYSISVGEYKKFTLDILTCAYQLLSLIDSMLEFSEIHSGSKPVELQSINLNELVKAAVDTFQSDINKNSLVVEIDIQPNLGKIIIDPEKFQKILKGYLSNAVKFTPCGKISIRVSTHAENYFLLEVADTGIGIAEKDISNLFSLFHQLDSGPNRRYPGLGVGLALVRQVARELGGRVWAESKVGEGSHFFALLPLAPVISI